MPTEGFQYQQRAYDTHRGPPMPGEEGPPIPTEGPPIPAVEHPISIEVSYI